MKKSILLPIAIATLFMSEAQSITFLSNRHRVTTPSGYIDIGPQNGSWAHIYSDRPNFIFNKTIYSHNGQFSAYSTSDLKLQTSGTTRMWISQATGNVGIGTSSPYSILEVSPKSTSWGEGIIINPAPNGYGAIFFRETEGSLNGSWSVGKQSSDNFAILKHSLTGMSGTSRIDAAFEINYTNGNALFGGNVGIGTTTPDEKLTVKGKIHTEEVKVDLSVPGPDYVFEEDYKLKSLEEIEAFIKSNKHLPEIPSAKEMEANGVELGVMNMLLLKKVEELTLHAIDQKRLIEKVQVEKDHLKIENKELKERLDVLFYRIEKLENN